MNQPPQPFRVMRIIARLNIGGPALHIINLNARLDALGYTSLLVSGTEAETEGSFKEAAVARGLRMEVLPVLGREISLTNDWSAIWQLYRLMRRDKPHIVHTHTAKAGFVGRLAAWLAGVPVVCHTFHGHVLQGYFGRTKTRVFLELEKWAARFTTRIITLSDRLKEELVDLGVARPESISVIPLGFDLRPFARQTRVPGDFRRELNLGAGQRLVGVVGRLVKIKNLPLFLLAAARVKNLLPEVHFVVVGDGEERQELEAQVRSLHLAEAVRFTGWRHDLPKIYADLDALVIASNNEGTPVSLIEAMAGGCPVIATSVGGVPDLLQGGQLGILVPRENPEALAGAIAAVLQNPEQAHRRACLAQTQVLQQYPLDRLVKDMDRLYLELWEETRSTVGKEMVWLQM